MNKKIYMIGAFIVLLLVLVIIGYTNLSKYMGDRKVITELSYQQGIQVGIKQEQQFVVNSIISDLNNYGKTFVRLPTSANQSTTITLIPQSTIIESVNKNGYYEFDILDNNNNTVQVRLILPQLCGK